MSATIWPGSQQNWYIAGAPDATLVLGQGGTIYVGDSILDNTTNDEYRVTALGAFDGDQTYIDCTFQKVVFDSNIFQVLGNLGWKINTARNYAASGIFLDSSRQPSLTNDTKVIASIKQVNVLLSTTDIVAEVSPDDSAWTLAGSIGDDAGVASSYKSMMSFPVPAGYYYRLRTTITGSGTITLVSCQELSQ